MQRSTSAGTTRGISRHDSGELEAVSFPPGPNILTASISRHDSGELEAGDEQIRCSQRLGGISRHDSGELEADRQRPEISPRQRISRHDSGELEAGRQGAGRLPVAEASVATIQESLRRTSLTFLGKAP